jgi:hypothetical protein
MVEPNAELLADERVQKITLCGQEWPVPRLGLEQNVEIYPLLARRLGLLNEVVQGRSTIDALTAEVLKDFASVVYWGLTRGHKISRAEFNALPIEVLELFTAAMVVGEQSGLFKRRGKANGVDGPLAVTTPGAPTPTPTG